MGRKQTTNGYLAADECDTTRFMTYVTQNCDADPGQTNGKYSTCTSTCPSSPMGINGQLPQETVIRNLERELRDVKKTLHKMQSRMEESPGMTSERVIALKEWRYIGLILDRFFFVLYVILLIASLAVLFPRR